uniref:Uncharacterized protein n=1 Tax=Physcomitrium patens TaxID=3218 RepID=A0A7I3YZ66_PHYPA
MSSSYQDLVLQMHFSRIRQNRGLLFGRDAGGTWNRSLPKQRKIKEEDKKEDSLINLAVGIRVSGSGRGG